LPRSSRYQSPIIISMGGLSGVIERSLVAARRAPQRAAAHTSLPWSELRRCRVDPSEAGTPLVVKRLPSSQAKMRSNYFSDSSVKERNDGSAWRQTSEWRSGPAHSCPCAQSRLLAIGLLRCRLGTNDIATDEARRNNALINSQLTTPHAQRENSDSSIKVKLQP
jgi:hypothetical protein